MQSAKRVVRVCLGALMISLLSSGLRAADWPMWRYDARRSGYSPINLPAKLGLRWSLDLPKPARAWPNEPRMTFDASYEPVVMGKSLFVGSPNDGSLRAYSTATGKLQWTFYTEGPVRFAPIAYKKKVYCASDDGRLYCLDAKTGELKWVFRAAPASRPDLRRLGNNRLISAWPVRGGPVLAKGKIYLASGIWPTMGVFVYAVDPESGRKIWSNARLNYISGVWLDHGAFTTSGLSPQGYLLVEGGKLIIPNGRATPAGVDAKTGKLLYYVQGSRYGHSRAIARGKYVLFGPKGVMDLATGREIGSRRFIPKENRGSSGWHRLFMGEAPKFQYKFMPACNAWSVLAPGVAYGAHGGVFYAYDLRRVKITSYEKTMRGEKMKPNKWEAPELWRLATRYAEKNPPSGVSLRAGKKLYGYAGSNLFGLELPGKGGKPRIVWKERIDGTPTSMLAADGKLFVVTDGGRILCYGRASGQPRKLAPATAPLPEAKDEWTEKASAVIKTAQTAVGCCIVLGLDSGRLVEEILKQSKLKVFAVDADRRKVDAMRDKLVAAGLYGKRAELFVGDPFKFNFPPFIAALIVSEKHSGAEISEKITAKKLFDTLRPFTGVAVLDAPASSRGALDAWFAKAALKGAELARAGDFAVLRRTAAPAGSAPWTHECADAARSYFSRDKSVRPPLAILWYGEGADHGFHKANDYGSGVKPQVAGGRLVAFQMAEQKLYALDVYTGMHLWKKNTDKFTRYATMEDGVYVACGNVCTVYDPATGKVLKKFTYKAPDGRRKLFVADIRVGENVIVVGVAPNKTRNIVAGLWDSTLLIGLDRETGRQLWTYQAKDRVNAASLSMGAGLVFLSDSPAVNQTAQMQRRGNPPKTLPATFTAIDESTGKIKWRTVTRNPFMTFNHFMAMRSFDDWTAYSEKCKILLAGKHKYVYGIDPLTGKQLWSAKSHGGQPTMLKGTHFIDQRGTICDIRTGRRVGSLKYPTGYGCNYAVASEHLFLRRSQSAAYTDLNTGKVHYVRSARSGCSNSLVVADGLLTVLNFSDHCVCNYPLQTTFAMVHMPIAASWSGTKPIPEPFGKK